MYLCSILHSVTRHKLGSLCNGTEINIIKIEMCVIILLLV